MRLPFRGYFPAGVLDGAGNFHLAWGEKVLAPEEYSIFYAMENAATGEWTEKVKISGDVNYAETPSITIRRKHIAVLFRARPNLKNLAITEIHRVQSFDGGKTWSPEVTQE